MMFIRTTLAVVLYWAAFGSLAGPLKLDGILPAGSQYALFVQSLGKDEQAIDLLEHNSDLLLPPASTQKVVTALAAKLILDDTFRFKTTLDRVDQDLVIRFSGDPTLTRFNLKQLFSHYKKRHAGDSINDVWLDNTAFVGHERAVGWPWEGLGACYSAPTSAVTLDRNCVHASVLSNGTPGSMVRVNLPKKRPIHVNIAADIVTLQQQKERLCNLELTFDSNNEYHLTGCWGKRKDAVPLKLAVQNPALYTKQMVEMQLAELGIDYKGKIRIGAPANDGNTTTLASHESAPLPKLLNKMLKASDNLIADNILKTFGGRHFNQPGSYTAGAVALRAVIKEKTGIDLSRAIIEDGSGLSRNNRMTARQLVEVIHYIYRNDNQLKLLGMLPVSGESGTMKYRNSVRKAPLKGRLTAKTGSLFGTKNIAGILQTAKGTRLLVAQIVTNYFPNRDKKKGKPVTRFEQKLYRELYNNY